MPRGRPRDACLNPTAVRDLAKAKRLPLYRLAQQADVDHSHLFQAIGRTAKGIDVKAVERLAGVLEVAPTTIAPTLYQPTRFLAVRPQDDPSKVVA